MKKLVCFLIFVVMGATAQQQPVKVEGARDLVLRGASPNPPPGYIRLYGDSTTGKLRCKDSSGDDCMPPVQALPHTHVEADITDLKHQHPVTTVANLPPASQHQNEIYVVTDAASKSTCSSAGGSTRVACISDGSSWTPAAGDGGGSGGGAPGGSPGYVQYKVNDTTFGGDPGLQWNSVDKNLGIGEGQTDLPLTISKNTSAIGGLRTFNSTPWIASFLTIERARGTAAAPQSIGSTDDIGGILFKGYLNGAMREIAKTIATASGAPSGNNQPAKIETFVNDGTALVRRMLIDSSGVTVEGNLSVTGSATVAGNQVATSGSNLGMFSSTTSSQLASVMSDETGTGSLVFSSSPTITSPALSNGSYAATWAVSGNCASLANGGALTINSSNQIVCSDDDGGTGGGVSSVFGRTGAVVAQAGDYTAAQVTNAFDKSASNDIGANYIDMGALAPANPGSGRYRVFISSATGKFSCKDATGADCMPTAGSGGHIIQDEGSALAQRSGLNFVGASVQATDDSANNRTNVTFDADLEAIAALSCAQGQIIKRGPSSWECGADQTGTGGGSFDPTLDYDLSGNNIVNASVITVRKGNHANGTALYRLACVQSNGLVATCTTTNASRTIGVCYSNCGTTGSARIAIAGSTVSCQFDGAVTAGNWVAPSSTQAGMCTDAGTNRPATALGILNESGPVSSVYTFTKGIL